MRCSFSGPAAAAAVAASAALFSLLAWISFAHVSGTPADSSSSSSSSSSSPSSSPPSSLYPSSSSSPPPFTTSSSSGLDSLYYSTLGARRLLSGPSPHLPRRGKHTSTPRSPHVLLSAVPAAAAAAAAATAATPGVATDANATGPVWPEGMPGRVVFYTRTRFSSTQLISVSELSQLRMQGRRSLQSSCKDHQCEALTTQLSIRTVEWTHVTLVARMNHQTAT